MAYLITEIEITEDLPSLEIPQDKTGFALRVKFQGKPIGFVMRENPGTSLLSPHELSEILGQSIGKKLLQEKIRSELIASVDVCQFPSLTVAICTKDRPENVQRCLNSLLPLQQVNDSKQFEILVIDNAPSNEQTKTVIDSLPSIRYVREPKPGLDFARNRALQEATGELLAFLDDDVVVDSGWLQGLKTAWAENPDAGGFTGLVWPYELETEAQILFEKRGGFGRGFEKIRHGQTCEGNPLYPCGAGIFGAGCNMTFRRDLLLKLGGFDEALDTGAPLPGGGDLDIFYRVVRSNYPLVYEPSYLVYHQHRLDLKGLQRQYWSWGLGFMAFIVKSYRQDPRQRSQFIKLVGWWFKDQLTQLVQSLTGDHVLPSTMILAELWGGIVGLLGEYSRSEKRSDQIRHQFPTETWSSTQG